MASSDAPGVATTAATFAPELAPLVAKMSAGDFSSCATLAVTGHSLGGGIATFLALHLHAAGRGPPALLTIAGPRLGNSAFAALYRERCAGREAVQLGTAAGL